MRFQNLEHFKVIADAAEISGGAEVAPNQLVLNLDGPNISLLLGDTELFQTTLASAPQGIQINVKNISSLAVSVSDEDFTGAIRRYALVSIGGMIGNFPGGGIFSYASSSSSIGI